MDIKVLNCSYLNSLMILSKESYIFFSFTQRCFLLQALGGYKQACGVWAFGDDKGKSDET